MCIGSNTSRPDALLGSEIVLMGWSNPGFTQAQTTLGLRTTWIIDSSLQLNFFLRVSHPAKLARLLSVHTKKNLNHSK